MSDIPSGKPVARLEQWEFHPLTGVLEGITYGHPIHADGSEVHTSKVLQFNKEDSWAETRNTVFRLGVPYGGTQAISTSDSSLKTSAEWAQEPEFSVNQIVDKTGWYQAHLYKAWNEDRIPVEEYRKRQAESVVLYGANAKEQPSDE